MLKIGHRGAKGHVQENTLASFQKALELGADMIELDVFKSKDNIPMVIHDPTLDRTTKTRGLVADFKAAALQQLGIPTLAEVFDLVQNRCEINIELKNFDTVASVLSLINTSGFPKANLLISSFDWNALQEVRFHDDSIRIGVLTETDLKTALTFAKFIEAYAIHPHFQLLTKENTLQIQSHHFKVFPWTVNEAADISLLKSFKVDGIISDYPERIC